MSTVIVEEPLTTKLAAAEKPLEVLAADGRLLGTFTPAEPGQLPRWMEGMASDEELARRSAEGGGRPLADILRDLEAKA